MDCIDARPLILDLRRERLAPVRRDELERHLDGCDACRRAAEGEAILDELLAHLPRPAAPAGLRQRLAAATTTRASFPAPPPPARRWVLRNAAALAASLALVVVGVLALRQAGSGTDAEARLVGELVTDHLRVLASQHPLDVESGGTHLVKPWFEGRLDFAPTVPTPAWPDLRLRGGAVGYVLDRKADVIEYALRAHAVTLLVLPVEGFPWPAAGASPASTSTRGIGLVRWRTGGLGYALVSDVAATELADLARAFVAVTGP
jgi:anti-sigma factor RsiW